MKGDIVDGKKETKNTKKIKNRNHKNNSNYYKKDKANIDELNQAFESLIKDLSNEEILKVFNLLKDTAWTAEPIQYDKLKKDLAKCYKGQVEPEEIIEIMRRTLFAYRQIMADYQFEGTLQNAEELNLLLTEWFLLRKFILEIIKEPEDKNHRFEYIIYVKIGEYWGDFYIEFLHFCKAIKEEFNLIEVEY